MVSLDENAPSFVFRPPTEIGLPGGRVPAPAAWLAVWALLMLRPADPARWGWGSGLVLLRLEGEQGTLLLSLERRSSMVALSSRTCAAREELRGGT